MIRDHIPPSPKPARRPCVRPVGADLLTGARSSSAPLRADCRPRPAAGWINTQTKPTTKDVNQRLYVIIMYAQHTLSSLVLIVDSLAAVLRWLLACRSSGVSAPSDEVERGPQLPRREVQAVDYPDRTERAGRRVMPASLPPAQRSHRHT